MLKNLTHKPLATALEWHHVLNVGSQFSDFFKTPEKILRCGSSQLNTFTIIRKVENPKIRGCLNAQIGLVELVGAQLVTLCYSPKF